MYSTEGSSNIMGSLHWFAYSKDNEKSVRKQIPWILSSVWAKCLEYQEILCILYILHTLNILDRSLSIDPPMWHSFLKMMHVSLHNPPQSSFGLTKTSYTAWFKATLNSKCSPRPRHKFILEITPYLCAENITSSSPYLEVFSYTFVVSLGYDRVPPHAFGLKCIQACPCEVVFLPAPSLLPEPHSQTSSRPEIPLHWQGLYNNMSLFTCIFYQDALCFQFLFNFTVQLESNCTVLSEMSTQAF